MSPPVAELPLGVPAEFLPIDGTIPEGEHYSFFLLMTCSFGVYYRRDGEPEMVCERCYQRRDEHNGFHRKTLHQLGFFPPTRICSRCRLDYCTRLPAVQCRTCIEVFLTSRRSLEAGRIYTSHTMTRETYGRN